MAPHEEQIMKEDSPVTAADGEDDGGAEFFNFCSLSRKELIRLAHGTEADRHKASMPLTKVTKDNILQQQPMSFFEHVSTILFLCMGVPNGVFSIPLTTFLIGKFVVKDVRSAFAVLGMIMLPLAILPQKFIPTRLHSWMAHQVLKYFSCRMISEERPTGRPQIYVAPPHGVFPYGNILAMLIWPSYCGSHFLGLASSAALRPPVFKQILRGIGVIDADRKSARHALEHPPHKIGISTGGVAEVFETNAQDECIILRIRVGLVKLAIRTGSDLVPCYLFGNTKLLSCWAGEGLPNGRNILEYISRKVGFALILLYGRFGLPIPRRIPILAVKGKAIPTHHLQNEDPTHEQIQIVQDQLIDDLQDLFNRHKHLYGWEEKHLVIK